MLRKSCIEAAALCFTFCVCNVGMRESTDTGTCRHGQREKGPKMLSTEMLAGFLTWGELFPSSGLRLQIFRNDF